MESRSPKKCCKEDEIISSFASNLILSETSGSNDVAKNCVKLLKDIISSNDWTSEQNLIDTIRRIGKYVSDMLPEETVIRNMIQRVLKIIHDEQTGRPEGEYQESLQKLILVKTHGDQANDLSPHSFKDSILAVIDELYDEIDLSLNNIADKWPHYIHADEVILTAGKSKSTLEFFKKAARKVKFQIIVVEHAPSCDGHETALELAKEGIKVTVISDSAVFAVMSRVNKVILGTHSVLANGGLKAISGTHGIALAAKYYSVPVIVCAPMFKLSPNYFCSYDQDAFNKLASPQDIFQFSKENDLSKVHVNNPVFDYVPPELVTSFISNIGGNAPSYVYRLLNDLYSSEDS